MADDERGGWPPEHDVAEFLQQDLAELTAEDRRIRRRSSEDPGTAGDEGEETWAALLRRWLSDYVIVTKGRIVFPDRWASPQVDLLVLRRSYPERLRQKKLYLSSGVLAAFECKNTLSAAHVSQAVATAAGIKERVTKTSGSIRGELRPPLLFGMLALSHSWRASGSTPLENTDAAIVAAIQRVNDPSSLIDVVCVSDVATWTLAHNVEIPGVFGPEVWKMRLALGVPPEGQLLAQYTRWHREEFGGGPEFLNPIAVLIAQLTMWVAWVDPELRPLADYYRMAGLLGQGTGIGVRYPLTSLSPEALRSARSTGSDFWNPNSTFVL